MEQTDIDRYIRPSLVTRQLVNRLLRRLTLMGLSVWGSRVLYVRGRRSGAARTTIVNVLDDDGHRYLVAPRGTTEWVRNLRAAGVGELRVGRRVESFAAVELGDEEKPPVLRSYLRRWKWEVGQFFDGVGPDAPDAELAMVAPGYPVFRVVPA